MSEITLMLKKVIAERHKEHNAWRIDMLERSLIPSTERELAKIRTMGLREYVQTYNLLQGFYREYKSLSGKEYQEIHTNCHD